MTALLPNKSAPISRSRFSSKLLTMPAPPVSVLFQTRHVPREEAVSAVSLPAKKADSSRQIRTMTMESQSFAVIGF